ncbi:MAG: cell wall hydrolase [Clostridia bacterium]|nr:cell wall hydrolase [Clostridia bacterium]MDD4047735.1 cell wall hydrolase [Clostridia bacterium]
MKKAIYTLVIISLILVFATSPLLASTTHRVKAGESLFLLSKKYSVTIAGIKNANGLRSDMILIGQTLRIPNASISSRSSSYNVNNEDLYWLSRVIHGEARGESYVGQVAVAAVILNRVKSEQFPDNIKKVVFQPLAFTAVADGQIYLTPNSSAIKAAREALTGSDPSGGALYYWNPAKATSKWIWSRTVIKQIGNHLFGR